MTIPSSSEPRRIRGRALTLRTHPEASAFLKEFQERHLSEVEFLLMQRHRALNIPGGSWLDADGPELRLSFHLEAMRASIDVSLEAARELLSTGDTWQYQAGLHVLASLAPEYADIDLVLQSGEVELTELLPRWTAALSQSTHPGVVELCTRATADERARVRAAATAVLGYRREGEPSRFLKMLTDEDAAVRGEAALALARLAHRPALGPIESLLSHGSTLDAEPLVRAALMLGSQRALTSCRQSCSAGLPPAGLLRLLGLAGDTQALAILRKACGNPDLREAGLEAMGLLGLGAAVPELLSHLEATSTQHRRAAARALGLMSGVGLQQKARVDEDDADVAEEADDMEQWSNCSGSWHRWWAEHASRVKEGQRWRHGRPFTLEGCMEELKKADTPPESRARATLELTLQSRQPFDFEREWPVVRQRQVLSAWEPTAPLS